MLWLPRFHAYLLQGKIVSPGPPVGVKGLVQSFWLSRAALQAPGKVTTTNPHFDRAIVSVGHRGGGKFWARAREGVG